MMWILAWNMYLNLPVSATVLLKTLKFLNNENCKESYVIRVTFETHPRDRGQVARGTNQDEGVGIFIPPPWFQKKVWLKVESVASGQKSVVDDLINCDLINCAYVMNLPLNPKRWWGWWTHGDVGRVGRWRHEALYHFPVCGTHLFHLLFLSYILL